MVTINRHSLYVTDSIKLYRLIQGYTTRKFSNAIGKSEGYVGLCEGSATEAKYNSGDYPLIAEILGCKLSDIMPPDDWEVSSTHEKVDKVVVSLADPAFVRRVLEGIQASPKAEVLADLGQLYIHLGTKNPAERAVIKTVWEKWHAKENIYQSNIHNINHQ